jgi:hypothetical protein
MKVLKLEGVHPDWLTGTPEEVRRAYEIFRRNEDILFRELGMARSLEPHPTATGELESICRI